MAADAELGASTLTGDPIVEEARRRWNLANEWEAQSRQRFVEDLKFAHGDSDNGYQWPNAVRTERQNQLRPCLTMNVTRQHNLQIVNEAKRNKSSVKVLALGGGATQESANIFRGLIRHIEYQSNAQGAYTTAREFQVNGGIGWWRIYTDYESPETFDQEIFIGRVWDPLAVFMDPDIQQRDGSDARWGMVFDFVPRDEFLAMYPKAEGLASMQPLGIGDVGDTVSEEGHVRIVEYFRKVKHVDSLVSFVDPSDGKRKTILASKLPKQSLKVLRDDPLAIWRETAREEIEWYLIAGEQRIDHTIWPGKFIPLVRVIGEETVIEGLLDRKGHTRSMKDSQRMYNYNSALSTSTKIPTPSGWTTIGQLQDGDMVFDQHGRPVRVEKVLPIRHDEDCYKITFDTGYSVVTDGGHIWKVEERGKRKAATYEWADKTISTAELAAKKHFIKITEPLQTEEVFLPLDPYLLGTWLGDGDTSNPVITSHSDDAEEQRKLLEELGYTVSPAKYTSNNSARFRVYGVRHVFSQLGLLGEKYAPSIYLRASRDQRLSLLQGLMDTDGHYATEVNQCVFINTNPEIVRVLLELCASLGIKTTVDRQPSAIRLFPGGNESFCQRSFRIQFTADPDVPVFRLARKAMQQTAGRATHWRRTKRIGIKSIERVESVPVRCITLDTPDHLYLCGEGMVPTHNSSQVEFVALQSKTPWVAAAKAIEEMETYWNTANTANHSVLPFNHIDDEGNPVPPPQRIDPPSHSGAYQQGMDTAFNQMMMVSGQWQNAMGMAGNERTGAAIQKRQEQSDTSVFHFQDNYGDALRFTGKQLIDLIPKIYDTRRVKKIIADDGTDLEIEIDPGMQRAFVQKMNHENKVIQRIFNPNVGKYDIASDVGPSYGSKRQETVDALTTIITQAPALTNIIGDLLLRAMDFDEAQEAAERLRRMIPPMALGQGPTQSEQQLQQQVTQLQASLAKSLEKQAKDQLKLVGKDEMRDIDVYKAETDRLKALADSLMLDQGGLANVVNQLVQEALSTHLNPILDANNKAVETQGAD